MSFGNQKKHSELKILLLIRINCSLARFKSFDSILSTPWPRPSRGCGSITYVAIQGFCRYLLVDLSLSLRLVDPVISQISSKFTSDLDVQVFQSAHSFFVLLYLLLST